MLKSVMTALAAGTLLAGMVHASATAANQMEPGLWRFTQSTGTGNGKARQRTQNRCVSAADAANPVMYFAPRASGAECAVTGQSAFGSQIKTQLRCGAGADLTEADIAITLDTPQHLTIATSLTRGKATAQMRGEGRLLGPCGAGGRKRR